MLALYNTMKLSAVRNLLLDTTWCLKRGLKPVSTDDNGDEPAVDAHSNTESPSSWLKVDPEIEYLAEIHINQPAQKWKYVDNI